MATMSKRTQESILAIPPSNLHMEINGDVGSVSLYGNIITMDGKSYNRKI